MRALKRRQQAEKAATSALKAAPPPELPARDGGPIGQVMMWLEIVTCVGVYGSCALVLTFHSGPVPWGYVHYAIMLQSLMCLCAATLTPLPGPRRVLLHAVCNPYLTI